MRKLALVAITLTLFTSPNLFAADGPPPPVQVVATVLGLSEEQVGSWMQILHARDAALQPLQQQVQSRQEALSGILQTPSPDPAAVGQLLIEIQGIQKQMALGAAQANTQFEQILTTEQRDRLQHVREAAQVCGVVPAFQATGLL